MSFFFKYKSSITISKFLSFVYSQICKFFIVKHIFFYAFSTKTIFINIYLEYKKDYPKTNSFVKVVVYLSVFSFNYLIIQLLLLNISTTSLPLVSCYPP